MAKPKQEKPKTFTEFVALVDALQAKADQSLWYRGCSAGKSSTGCRPSGHCHGWQGQVFVDMEL